MDENHPPRAKAAARRDANILEVLATQRAHRAYLADPVPRADVEAMLTAATHAPSAENSQPWEFVVVTEPEGRRAVASLMRRAWEGGGREASRGVLEPSLFADVDRGLTEGFAGAPVLVVCCGNLERTRRETLASSIFPAVQNLLLAATALGYGSALTTIATVFADELRADLAMPDTIVPMAVVPIGRPARHLGPPRREPATGRTHWESWNSSP